MLTAQIEEIQRFTANLPNFIEDRIPLFSKAFITFLFLFGTVGLTIGLGYYDLNTPTNTNTYSVVLSAICHYGIVVGPAALFALKATNYAVYPSIYGAVLLSRPNLLNIGKM
jgi:hypothetical protein